MLRRPRFIVCAIACGWLVTAQLPDGSSQLSAAGVQLPAAGEQLPASGAQLPPSGAQPPAQLPELELLKPTVHAALPPNIDDYWFAPRAPERAGVRSGTPAEAAAAYEAATYAASLPSARQAASASGPLQPYARLYAAQSLLRQSNAAEAEK